MGGEVITPAGFDELSTSFFRFARQLREKGRPRCITDALCQTINIGVYSSSW
jgi:hypothetical protein